MLQGFHAMRQFERAQRTTREHSEAMQNVDTMLTPRTPEARPLADVQHTGPDSAEDNERPGSNDKPPVLSKPTATTTEDRDEKQ